MCLEQNPERAFSPGETVRIKGQSYPVLTVAAIATAGAQAPGHCPSGTAYVVEYQDNEIVHLMNVPGCSLEPAGLHRVTTAGKGHASLNPGHEVLAAFGPGAKVRLAGRTEGPVLTVRAVSAPVVFLDVEAVAESQYVVEWTEQGVNKTLNVPASALEPVD